MKILISRCLLVAIIMLGIAQGGLIYYVFFICVMQPVLQVDKVAIDFGAIPSDIKITQGVRLTNTGKSVLIINKLLTGCGCTEVKLSRNRIEPDTSEMLYVTMELKGYSQKTSIYIFSNDPKKSIFELSVKAEPTLQSMIEPSVIDFGLIKSVNDLPITKSIELLLNSERFIDTNLNVFSFKTSEQYLIIDDSVPPEENTKSILISLQKNTPVGDIFTELHIDDGKQDTTVRILGNVRGLYYALPQTLMLGPISAIDDIVSTSIILKTREVSVESNPVEIIAIDLSDSLKDLLIVSQNKSDEIFVVMNPNSYTGVWSSQKIYGTIRIKCTNCNAFHQEVNVPVLIILKAPKIRDQ